MRSEFGCQIRILHLASEFPGMRFSLSEAPQDITHFANPSSSHTLNGQKSGSNKKNSMIFGRVRIG